MTAHLQEAIAKATEGPCRCGHAIDMHSPLGVCHGGSGFRPPRVVTVGSGSLLRIEAGWLCSCTKAEPVAVMHD